MGNDNPIIRGAPTLQQVPPGEILIAEIPQKGLGQGAPGEPEARAYIRQAGKLFSWTAYTEVTARQIDKTIWGQLMVKDVPAGTADYDKFLVLDTAQKTEGMLKYRTSAQMISDLGIATADHVHAIDDLTDVTISGPADNDLLQYDNGSALWVDRTLAEAGVSPVGHTHDHGAITGLGDDDHPQYPLIANLNDILVGTGLDIANGSGTIVGGDATVSLDLTEVIATDGANRVLTSDGDGTLTAEANLVFDATGLGVGIASPGALLEVSDIPELDGSAPIVIRVSGLRNSSSWIAGADVTGLDFYSSDGSGSGAGVRAAIRMTTEDTAGSKWGMRFLVDNGTSLIEAMRINELGYLGIGTDTVTYTTTWANESTLGDVSYSSGWAGNDWALTYISSNATLEIDDLWVRGALNVYELIINQISAVNGGMVISAANGRVASVSGSPSTEAIVFEDPESTTITQFAPGDILLIQNVNLDSTTVVKRIVREVNTISGMTVTCKALSDAPADSGSIAKGDVVVVIGNTKGGSASANVLSAAQYAGTGGWLAGGASTVTFSYDPAGSGISNVGHPSVLQIESGDTTNEYGKITGLTFVTGKDYVVEFDYITASTIEATHRFVLLTSGNSTRYTYNFPVSTTTWEHLRIVVPESDLLAGVFGDVSQIRIYSTSTGAATDEVLVDNISIRIAGTVRDASIFMTSTDAWGPYVQVMDGVDSWAAWKDPDKIKAVMGNLEGKYGYVTEVYGFAAGKKDNEYITIDPINGIRIIDGKNSDNVLLQANAEVLTVGDNFVYTSSTSTLKVAAWTVNSSTFTGGNATLNSTGILSLGTGNIGYGQANMIYIDGSGAGRFSVGTGFGYTGDVLSVGNWTVTTTTLEQLTSNVGVKIDGNSSTPKIQIGDLDEQHVDILGADGTMNWYKSDGIGGNTLVVSIDDTIYTSIPGIKIIRGGLFLEDSSSNLNGYFFHDAWQHSKLMLETVGGTTRFLEMAWNNAGRYGEFYLRSLGTNGSAGTPLHWYSATGLVSRYTSSLRYKEDVVALEAKTDRIFDLEVKSYTSKSDRERTFGLIAEEVYEVAPDIVNLDDEGRPDSIKGPLLDYMMLEELKKLRKEVDELIAAKETGRIT